MNKNKKVKILKLFWSFKSFFFPYIFFLNKKILTFCLVLSNIFNLKNLHQVMGIIIKNKEVVKGVKNGGDKKKQLCSD